mgnify:CR=1 FL=1
MSDIAKLQIGDKSYEFPLIKGTENEVAIDIKSLRGVTDSVISRASYIFRSFLRINFW